MVALFRMPPQSLHGGSRSPARTRSSTCCIGAVMAQLMQDRKSTRLNSSHGYISYAVFCLKKKKQFYLCGHKIFTTSSLSNAQSSHSSGHPNNMLRDGRAAMCRRPVQDYTRIEVSYDREQR